MTLPSQSTFRILFVCTGGICRSAFAEILARHLLRERLGVVDAARFTVASAGTSAVLGATMHPFSRAELARWGLAGIARGFRSYPLDAPTVAGSDLVLTAERRHRKAAVELQPSALRTTFCLREMTRLAKAIRPDTLPGDPVERAKAAVAAARRLRGTALYVPPEEDAVPDPVSLGPGGHHHAAKLIEESLLGLIALLGSGNGGRTLSNRFPAIDSIR
ncbi:arsenate reductase/protein-tyrosine-phosphatase family protein [Amycolatopsis pigmentata]|uniref:Phosphotyrosine protein phosphatase I domain-containing protein n=1 Tax=Amycolatopsis pigmentata TaxID=450801 RepID=A0ABW5FQL9_9PSEU